MNTIDPSSTALLVMDYQPAILGRVGDAEALLGRAVRAIDLARGAGLHIGHVRVAFEPADVAKVPASNAMFSQAAAAMPADAPHTQFHERVAPRAGDIVVRRAAPRPEGDDPSARGNLDERRRPLDGLRRRRSRLPLDRARRRLRRSRRGGAPRPFDEGVRAPQRGDHDRRAREEGRVRAGFFWRIPPNAAGAARVRRLLALAFRGLGAEDALA